MYTLVIVFVCLLNSVNGQTVEPNSFKMKFARNNSNILNIELKLAYSCYGLFENNLIPYRLTNVTLSGLDQSEYNFTQFLVTAEEPSTLTSSVQIHKSFTKTSLNVFIDSLNGRGQATQITRTVGPFVFLEISIGYETTKNICLELFDLTRIGGIAASILRFCRIFANFIFWFCWYPLFIILSRAIIPPNLYYVILTFCFPNLRWGPKDQAITNQLGQNEFVYFSIFQPSQPNMTQYVFTPPPLQPLSYPIDYYYNLDMTIALFAITIFVFMIRGCIKLFDGQKIIIQEEEDENDKNILRRRQVTKIKILSAQQIQQNRQVTIVYKSLMACEYNIGAMVISLFPLFQLEIQLALLVTMFGYSSAELLTSNTIPILASSVILFVLAFISNLYELVLSFLFRLHPEDDLRINYEEWEQRQRVYLITEVKVLKAQSHIHRDKRSSKYLKKSVTIDLKALDVQSLDIPPFEYANLIPYLELQTRIDLMQNINVGNSHQRVLQYRGFQKIADSIALFFIIFLSWEDNQHLDLATITETVTETQFFDDSFFYSITVLVILLLISLIRCIFTIKFQPHGDQTKEQKNIYICQLVSELSFLILVISTIISNEIGDYFMKNNSDGFYMYGVYMIVIFLIYFCSSIIGKFSKFSNLYQNKDLFWIQMKFINLTFFSVRSFQTLKDTQKQGQLLMFKKAVQMEMVKLRKKNDDSSQNSVNNSSHDLSMPNEDFANSQTKLAIKKPQQIVERENVQEISNLNQKKLALLSAIPVIVEEKLSKSSSVQQNMTLNQEVSTNFKDRLIQYADKHLEKYQRLENQRQDEAQPVEEDEQIGRRIADDVAIKFISQAFNIPSEELIRSSTCIEKMDSIKYINQGLVLDKDLQNLNEMEIEKQQEFEKQNNQKERELFREKLIKATNKLYPLELISKQGLWKFSELFRNGCFYQIDDELVISFYFKRLIQVNGQIIENIKDLKQLRNNQPSSFNSLNNNIVIFGENTINVHNISPTTNILISRLYVKYYQHGKLSYRDKRMSKVFLRACDTVQLKQRVCYDSSSVDPAEPNDKIEINVRYRLSILPEGQQRGNSSIGIINQLKIFNHKAVSPGKQKKVVQLLNVFDKQDQPRQTIVTNCIIVLFYFSLVKKNLTIDTNLLESPRLEQTQEISFSYCQNQLKLIECVPFMEKSLHSFKQRNLEHLSVLFEKKGEKFNPDQLQILQRQYIPYIERLDDHTDCQFFKFNLILPRSQIIKFKAILEVSDKSFLLTVLIKKIKLPKGIIDLIQVFSQRIYEFLQSFIEPDN